MTNKFKIIVPTYNSSWIDKTLDSIYDQSYREFEVCVVIDPPSEKTIKTIKKFDERFDNLKYIINDKRQYALKNIKNGIETISDDKEDIIAIIDGDDWLIGQTAFSLLNEKVYDKEGIWVSYGSYAIDKPTARYGWEKHICDLYEDNYFRTAGWHATHLKTFKRFLWDNIKEIDFKEDPKKSSEYFKVNYDRVIMYPMMEMSGIDRIHRVKRSIYKYNINELSVHNSFSREERLKLKHNILSRKPYRILSDKNDTIEDCERVYED